MPRLAAAAFVAFAVTAQAPLVSVAASGAPSQAVVRAGIAKLLNDRLEFRTIQIAPGRIILNVDAGNLSIPPGTTIYPVLASFTEYRKNGVVQDRTQYLYFYRDEFGTWATQMVANSHNKTVERP